MARMDGHGTQPLTHEIVRSDGVVIARGADIKKLHEMSDWLNETPVAGEPATFSVKPKAKK